MGAIQATLNLKPDKYNAEKHKFRILLPKSPYALDRHDLNDPKPKGCYLYFLFNGGRLVYVGCSCDISNRLHWHKWNGKVFDSFAFLGCDPSLEKYYINVYKPKFNNNWIGVLH